MVGRPMPHRKIDDQPNEKLARQAQGYRGKWVVIVRDEIVMAGDDPMELQQKAWDHGIEYDGLEFIPDEKEPPILIL